MHLPVPFRGLDADARALGQRPSQALAERTPTAPRAEDHRRKNCGEGPNSRAFGMRPLARSRRRGRRCSCAGGTSVWRPHAEDTTPTAARDTTPMAARAGDNHQRSLGGVLGEVGASADASVREIIRWSAAVECSPTDAVMVSCGGELHPGRRDGRLRRRTPPWTPRWLVAVASSPRPSCGAATAAATGRPR